MSQAAPSTLSLQNNLPLSTLNQQQLIFDFTKRKRWADLLVSELTEAIMLVLSQTGQVWYCGPAVEDLLGWKDEEVVDGNFCDIMNSEDRQTFQRQFTESVQNRSDLLTYARLQCKSANDLYPNVPAPAPVGLVPQSSEGSQLPKPAPKEILFEIKGYPYFIAGLKLNSGQPGFNINDFRQMQAPDANVYGTSDLHGPSATEDGVFKCFFAMAKPYPSRNTAMLNTFLELKMENERLQARLQAAKAKSEALKVSQVQDSSQQHQDSIILSQPNQAQQFQPPYSQHGQSYSYTFAPQSSRPPVFESAVYKSYDSPASNAASTSTTAASNQTIEDDGDSSVDPNLPRKKSKRVVGTEMYVCMTCGRTDSPEWRKGPQGPKTLCNACGLRWAKSVRTAKEPSGPSTTSSAHSLGLSASPSTPHGNESSPSSGTMNSRSPGSDNGPAGPGAPYIAMFDFYPGIRTGQFGPRR